MKENDLEGSFTHTRPESEGESPSERQIEEQADAPAASGAIFISDQAKKRIKDGLFNPEQEEARKRAKNGELGIKFDEKKLRWDLLPFREVEQVVKILTFGAEKYADDNWKHIPDLQKRYFAAAMRHLSAWIQGEKLDKESGQNHLSHAACCILFTLWKDNENSGNNK